MRYLNVNAVINTPHPPSQAFLQMQPPLSPALVLSILGDASPDLSALYLEAALHMGLALPQVRRCSNQSRNTV